MMKKLIALRFLFGLFTILLLFSFITKLSYASTFTDNFDSGNLNKWDIVDITPQCNTDIGFKDGSLVVTINNQIHCLVNFVPKDEYWKGIGNNYMFEADVKFITGVDHNLVFRYLPNGNVYEIHFQSPGDFALNLTPNPYFKTNVFQSYPFNNDFYHIKVIVDKLNFKIYINNQLVKEAILSEELPPGKIALRVGTGDDAGTQTWYDNIKVTNIDGLNILPFYQNDHRWINDVYDLANYWSKNSTIGSWGCALTSAVMVFRYYGINLLPNGNEILPNTLNDWLNQQNDGYLDGGYVNWVALSRLSKLTKSINKTSFDALESSVYDFSSEVIENDINNNPVILDLGGHFVVAKSIFENVLGINDPYYQDKTSIDLNNTTPKSLVRFTPSLTDLSYILITTKDNIKLQLEDNKKKLYGKYSSLEPIKNNFSEFQPSLNQFTLEKAESRNYYLKISGDKNKKYNLKFYFYNKDGNVKIIEYSGKTDKKEQDKLSIKFDKNDLKKDAIRPDGNEFGKLKED